MITTIFVIGAGYVGLSNAVLLAQPKLANQVTLVDIDAKTQQMKVRLMDRADTELYSVTLDPKGAAI